jgi:hypothetical protein
MTDSILLSTKEKLGLAADYTVFDSQVIDFINSAFSTVAQIGLGPPAGFMINGTTEEWDDVLVSNLHLNGVKAYIFLKVRQMFDPPTTGYHVTAMEKQIQELEWRLNTYREGEQWSPPLVPTEGLYPEEPW